ncbi:ATP-dependent nuclease [Tenacibaculum larymnensis]|uniref:AAA family ATPase n=1 Tax=Tenacibaculum larymnensis TaxID=2878201 RepID=A0A9X4ILK4_9FLAO|nr:AAA family ATPase [Tenacibaculum larymnensis]MDE1206739.1 AAA family ATPase [Tenacibaculum larymnensis]
MKIKNVEIKNFRLLEDIKISLDDKISLIVGRNNSGKTSVIEVFNNFFNYENSTFIFEDFSISSHIKFNEAIKKYNEYLILDEGEEKDKLEKLYKNLLPSIELGIYIVYDEKDDGKLGSLSEFIMDLDEERKDAYIKCLFSINEKEAFIEQFIKNSADFNNDFLEYVKQNIKNYYTIKFYSIDKDDIDNYREIERKSLIENVFITQFIYAQRNLDDQTKDKNKRLSKGFENYYRLNKEQFKEDVKTIEGLLNKFSNELDKNYKKLFKGVFKDLEKFGIEDGVTLQKLIIKSLFNAESILKGNTQLFYNQDASILPESYNGLGYSNLIYMILQFISFYEAYDKREPRPNFQLIFIEEPEAHLHPQMQQVFIKNINDFIKEKHDWNVQVIITTHSSHVVEKGSFEGIRYFDNTSNGLKIKNLSDFKNEIKDEKPETIKFLKQYLVLKNCDMFFADKVIMVEGTVERLLLSEIISEKFKKLNSQYLSVIEVGGAYAHRFKEFLEFLNIKTLIITDIDSINSKKKKGKKACKVNEGDKTSNAILKKWLPKKELLDELISLKEEHKYTNNKRIRVTYQIPEKGNKKEECGRSFEDAFILANAKELTNASGEIIGKRFKGKSKEEIYKNAYEIAKKISKNKTDFAFDIMMMENWNVPKYINQGLTWLEKDEILAK